ncbi:MAG: hypothetical protein K0R05_131 [Anaerocolumna sp.]|jgi:flagellar hook-associated protein 1 FlgK|nr:hypothetical protein [Anaerocolumna sp.]
MPSTFFGLNIGTSGLYTYQAALNTTAHNISNTETTGYSRQVLNQKAATAIRVNSSYGMVGAGVTATGISQVRDSYYDLKYWKYSAVTGEYNAKQYYTTEIENYFNEVSVKGFTTSYNSVFDSIQDLTKDPSSATTRTQLVNYSKNLTEYFNGMANSLKAIQEESNFEVKTQVDRINSLAQQIAGVTKQINTLEAGGGTANDLRDQRNNMIDELSEIVNVSVSENVVGQGVGVTSYVVKIEGQTLVNTNDFNTLKVVPREEKANQNDVDGLYDIQWNNGNDFSFQNNISGSYLKSLFQVRDGNNGENLRGTWDASADATPGDNVITITNSSINDISKLNIPGEGNITINNQVCKYTSYTVSGTPGNLQYTFTLENPPSVTTGVQSVSIGEGVDYKGIPYYMGQLNELVRTFAMEFNTLHKSGYDLNGDAGTNFFGATVPSTGAEYNLDAEANSAAYRYLTADNFTVSDTIYKNPSKIATSDSKITDGVENSNIAHKLYALKSDTAMFKQGTPESFFQTLVAEIGVDSKKVTDNAKNQQDILKMISNQRLSVSGVDVDEEAMNLVMFQNAYNLSAKAISVMNQIYDKLINDTGV